MGSSSRIELTLSDASVNVFVCEGETYLMLMPVASLISSSSSEAATLATRECAADMALELPLDETCVACFSSCRFDTVFLLSVIAFNLASLILSA